MADKLVQNPDNKNLRETSDRCCLFYTYRGIAITQDREVASGWWGRWRTDNYQICGGSWKEIKEKIDQHLG